jgi:hypothetical protein
LKEEVLNETHELRLVVHPGSDEIYRDLKEFYSWPIMKK